MITAIATPETQADASSELKLLVNNGDRAAAAETVSRLGFKDEASLFRYALAVLSQSATRAITITHVDGQRRTLSPNNTLLVEPSKESL